MTRYLAIDVRDTIIDILTNGTTDIKGVVRKSFREALIDIDAKRGTSTIQPLTIDYKWLYNQSPSILVDMENSTIINTEFLTSDYNITPEIFSCLVMFKIKAADNLVQDMIENYIEAILEILHGYCDCNINWILAVETDRQDLYQELNQTEKAGMVRLEIRVN